MVLVGIEKTRKQFGQPSTLALIRSWGQLVASAFKGPESHTLKIDGATLRTSAGDVSVIIGVPKDAPLERRIDVLEQNLANLRAEVKKNVQQLSTRIVEVNETVKAQQQQWELEHRKTSGQIQQFAVGGLRYEIVGLAWLLFGTLFSNLPEECARMFGPLAAIFQ